MDDEQFSSFLETLNLDYSISVSFPITSTLDTGEEFIITSKEELKNSIDNCLGEELVFECNQLLQNCLWKVGYNYNFENPYLGALFQELNGFTTFNNQNTLVAGSWTVFLIENELHLNIGLVNDTEASEFFNYDWKVEYLDANSLLLKNEDREVILNQRCDDDFTECTNFIFEVCENDAGGGISNFILDDYKFCIFDTLELSEDLPISFFQT